MVIITCLRGVWGVECMERVYRVLVGVAGIAAAGLMGMTSANRAAVPAVRDESVYRAARIDLNMATRAELCTLPGVGETMADKIIADRDANGSFRTPEELLRVDGIGDATLERLREWIWVEPTEE